MNPPDRSAIRDADIDDLLGALARADLEQALSLLVLIADLRPDMPIAEAFDHVPKARDLVN
ncbi:hypothetical protein CKO31_22980 [Thiohalocapsa halophila]|uniref:Uncharacterized protein n=1 Tax=Thiohalocapsa halophila TaxID=69359 RepID=A0ABS1CNN7_9GAMM|nr:hypothetical protein [Thiohalocapsa halophila]MBK1633556.1 hypothetical protein [Thiohalocapsa halophila]